MDLSSVELKMLQEELLLLLLFRNSLSQGCSYDHGTKKKYGFVFSSQRYFQTESLMHMGVTALKNAKL